MADFEGSMGGGLMRVAEGIIWDREAKTYNRIEINI